MASIRIIRTPAGEAPEEIRKSWVGLILPVAEDEQGRRKRLGYGVLTGPKSFLAYLVGFLLGKYTQYDGYAVKVMDAIAILAKSNPQAAQWWRKNTPHLLTPTGLFLFDAEACEEITSESIPVPSPKVEAVPLTCPRCGGRLSSLHQGLSQVTCEYCGTAILIK